MKLFPHLGRTLACVLVFVLLMGFFWRRVLWLAALWWSDGLYSLSALVPLVSLAIVYSKRNRLRALPLRPSPAGILLLLAALAVTLAADWLNVLHSFTPLLLVLALAGIILSLWGSAVLRELLFPLTFLLMLLPIPPVVLERIDLPLQILCARVVELMSHAAGFALQRAGCMLLFPGSAVIDVAPACNGVRSALTMLMLALVYVYLSRGRWPSKLAVLAVALPLAYFANLVRLFGLVFGAHFLGSRFMDYEPAFDHAFGLLVFCASVSMLLFWARVVKCEASMPIS